MGQKIKCTITEERLRNLVAESIEEVLLEAQNDEGLGGWLGKMAGKISNGVNKFRDDFNAQRNGQLYGKRDYDAYAENGVDNNARNYDPAMNKRYRAAVQRGASSSAPGTFTTQYGDTVGGGNNTRGGGGNQDLLAQIQQALASLTQQVQAMQQGGAGSNSTPQGETSGAQGSTGGAQGSTGGAQGSTGGAQGSTGGAQGSTGGAQGGTGGAQDSQAIIDRQRATQRKTKSRNLSPDDYKVNDGKTSTAAQNNADLHKGTNPDNPFENLEESRKRQITGNALQRIISESIKKYLNENLDELDWKFQMMRNRGTQQDRVNAANAELQKKYGVDRTDNLSGGSLKTNVDAYVTPDGSTGYLSHNQTATKNGAPETNEPSWIQGDTKERKHSTVGNRYTKGQQSPTSTSGSSRRPLNPTGASQFSDANSDMNDFFSGEFERRVGEKRKQLGNYGKMPDLGGRFK